VIDGEVVVHPLVAQIDNQNYRYTVEIRPESGTFSINGALVQALSCYVLIDSSEGGPDLRVYP